MANTITIADTASATVTGQGGQSITTGAPTPGSAIPINVPGSGVASITISGTWVGTLVFESTSDYGVTYNPVDALIKGVNSVVSSVTANGTFLVASASAETVRVRCTAYTSGTATIVIASGIATDLQHTITSTGGGGSSNVVVTSGTLTAVTAITNALPAGTNTLGGVSAVASAAGGASTYAATGGTGNALLTATAVAVKASAGKMYAFEFTNTGASVAYVQIFDVAQGSVTLGTTVPKMVIWVPAGGAFTDAWDAGVQFNTAITVAATTTPTGSTAPATGILAAIVYA